MKQRSQLPTYAQQPIANITAQQVDEAVVRMEILYDDLAS
jgi:hypothetical protein